MKEDFQALDFLSTSIKALTLPKIIYHIISQFFCFNLIIFLTIFKMYFLFKLSI